MTEDQDQTEQAQEQPEAEASTEQHEDTATARLRREAARYRTQLRATEKERDALLERVGGFQRAEVERQVTESGGLETGADLWAGGVELADLLTDEGDLDPEAINAAKAKVIAEHPAWKQPSPSFDGGVRTTAVDTTPSFGEALKRAAG